ncbi:MAG TPA: DUF3987 domain-containing protein [Bryobacteraceae bacterium]
MTGAIEFSPREIAEYYRIRAPRVKQTKTAQWRGLCPIHKGQGDNFAVEAATGRWTCHSGCGGAGGDIFDLEERLRGGGDFTTRKAEVFRLVGHVEPEYRRNGHQVHGSSTAAGLREVERYPYVDRDGKLLFEVVRYSKPDGGKVFRQRKPDGRGGVIWNLEGVDRVPYRLPKVLSAETIFLPEGERDAHTLEAWGLTASCNPGGCGASRLYEGWRDFFRGRHIVVLPDSDGPGRKHAAAVAAALLDTSASVRIVELPGLPEKGDVTDWKQAGGTLEQFREVVKAAPKIDTAALAAIRARWGLGDEKPSHEARAEAADDWPKPERIHAELPPVEAFSEDLLPDSFRHLVADVTERMQVPIDYPAVVMVLCLAGAVNRRAVIQPKANDTGWLVVPNLWGGIVGPPGVMKSPVIQAATRPLNQIQAEWRREHDEGLREHVRAKEECDLRQAAWREQFKAASKSGNAAPDRPEDEPQEPKLRRLIVNDATFEALHQTMNENPAGVMVIRDELTGWWSTLDRAGREGERAFSLQAWNGDTGHTIDRIGRGTIHVEACCMSMLGGIQPGRLRSYLVDALRDGPSNDGLIQRFQLLVWPDTTDWSYVDRAPDAASEAQAARVFQKLVEMDAKKPAEFRFAPDAQELFIAWLSDLEAKLRGDELHPALVSHLSKYRSLMPSLAVLFHLADAAARGENADSVSLCHARQAAAWCEYLESHARRVYSCITTPQMRAARELAEKIKQRKIGADGFFSCRDVYLKGWSGLDTPEAVRQAAEVLEDAGWIRGLPSESSDPLGRGRPSNRYAVNPRISQ